MNFIIFRDFSRIFLNLFKYIKSIKSIKRLNKKGFINCVGPTWMRRGTEAMWQGQTDPRERLRGAEVTHVLIRFTRNIAL